MSFKVLYVAATEAESEALFRLGGRISDSESIQIGNIIITSLVTGIGSVATAWSLIKWLSANDKPDLVINAGIAGSFKKEIKIGEVVMPVNDCFADLGIEDHNDFLSIHDAGFSPANEFPFHDGIIEGDKLYINKLKNMLKPVKAISVNTVSGSEQSIKKLKLKFNPDIETMEGATFFYICAREKLAFLSIRAISNIIEPRNKTNWDIPLAITRLSEKLKEIILILD